MLWQILSSEFGAIDTGGEAVRLSVGVDGELLHAINEGGIDSAVFGDGS